MVAASLSTIETFALDSTDHIVYFPLTGHNRRCRHPADKNKMFRGEFDARYVMAPGFGKPRR
jgi:hypothetical protein